MSTENDYEMTEGIPPATDSPEYQAAFAEFAGVKAEATPVENPPEVAEEAEAAMSEEAPAAGAPSTDEQPAFDPWANLSPEQKEYFSQVTRSTQGRYQAAQKQRDEYKRRVEEYETKLADKKPIVIPRVDDKDVLFLDQNFPEVKRVLDKYPQMLESIINERLSQALAPLTARAIVAEEQTQLDLLAQAHPDFNAVISTDEFDNWLAAQPKAVKAAWKSPDAEDAIWLLDQYKSSLPKPEKGEVAQPTAVPTVAVKAPVAMPTKGSQRPSTNKSASYADDFNYFASKLENR